MRTSSHRPQDRSTVRRLSGAAIALLLTAAACTSAPQRPPGGNPNTTTTTTTRPTTSTSTTTTTRPTTSTSTTTTTRPTTSTSTTSTTSSTTSTTTSTTSTSTTSTTLPQTEPGPRNIYQAKGGRWVKSSCQMFPDDSYWHADVRGLPTIEPVTPDGSGLAGFPVADNNLGPFDDDLRLHAALTSRTNKTINRTNEGDPFQWVTLQSSFAQNSEFTKANVIGSGIFARVNSGQLRQRVPANNMTESSSNDRHAYFVDLHTCSLHEYAGWNGFPGVYTARNATLNDLRTNERRLSVRENWWGPENNGESPRPIDSPWTYTPPSVQGMDGIDMRAPRGTVTSSGGSGLAASGGMVRLDEVFATPIPDDETVAGDGHIDHAIAVVVPTWHVRGVVGAPKASDPPPFVWPATRSDGCSNRPCSGDVSGIQGSPYNIAMGSRLRLKQEQCDSEWAEPQADAIVRAMCRFGIVVTDTAGHFMLNVERPLALQGRKWRKAAEDELARLTLRDFEMVDASKVATVDPDALWSSAVTWVNQRFTARNPAPDGWYSGTFWGSMVKCEVPDSTGAHNCTDPVLGPAADAVNSPDWLKARAITP